MNNKYLNQVLVGPITTSNTAIVEGDSGQVLVNKTQGQINHILNNISPAQYTNIIYVDGGIGNDTTGNGSYGKPYQTMTKATSVATSGSAILPSPGTYTESWTLPGGVSIIGQSNSNYTSFSGNITYSSAVTSSMRNVTLKCSSGSPLTISGSNNINLILENISINSGNGASHAINWTNTNSSSTLNMNGSNNIYVTTSSSGVYCIYSSSSSAGNIYMTSGTTTLAESNVLNTALSLNGAISIVHDGDVINGNISVADTAIYTGSNVLIKCGSNPALTTTSSNVSLLQIVGINSTATPVVTGAGGFAFANVALYGSGHDFASTLNSGIGPLTLPVTGFQLSPQTIGSGAIAAGTCNGLQYFDNTRLNFVTGTTKNTIPLAPINTTRIQRGSASITPVANTPTSVTVTFPVAFSQAPYAVACALSAVPGSTVIEVAVNNVTATSMDVVLYRTNTTNTVVYWIAMD